MKTITLIAAVARNRAIGLRGQMPWHLPDELRHFKQVTLGKTVIMGRKTREAIGMALPGRQNIVVSRNPGYIAQDSQSAPTLERAIEIASGRELMVIGGGELYLQSLPMARRMFLTIVECEPEADTWFPEWSEQQWRMAGSVLHAADERHTFAFEMQEWLRI